MTDFDIAYQNALRQIMTNGYEELNARTGHKTKALPGLTFNLDGKNFPMLTLRKIPIRVFVAEQVWFLTGSKNPDELLGDYTKIWHDFREADGTVGAAYGNRWRKHFGRDQWGDLVKLLEKDPSSRHGVIVTWDPSDDGLGTGTPKANVPCPYTFTFNIIGGKLHLHNIIRSNDMLLGCPHDMAGFALLQHLLAAHLGVEVGHICYSVSNAHIYDIHYDTAWEIINRTNDHANIHLDVGRPDLKRAEAGDRLVIDELIAKLSSQYNPSPAIAGIKIVL